MQTIISTSQPPDILIVTETKLKRQQKKQWLHRLFTSYTVKHTTHPEASKAGVLLAVSKTLTELGELKMHTSPIELNGFAIHASLVRPNSTPMHLVAIYCPHQLPIRKEIYTYVSQVVTDARANKEQLLITGDFNAVIQKEDRASGNIKSADTLHKEFITANGLTPLDTPLQGAARSFTYRKGVEQTPFSRLDDILTLQPLLHTHTETLSMAGTNLDHDVLVAQIEYAQLGLLPPLPQQATPSPNSKRPWLRPTHEH
jgi:hypothetical protein